MNDCYRELVFAENQCRVLADYITHELFSEKCRMISVWIRQKRRLGVSQELVVGPV